MLNRLCGFGYFLLMLLFVFFVSCQSVPEEVVIKEVPVVIPAIIQPYEIIEYDLPDTVFVCGEKIDLTNKNNFEMFEREFIISVWDRAQVFMWLKRAGQFFPYFEKRLKAEGLPDDLKYLAVAESSLHTHIKSKAGALGIWQFMKETAKRYGLRVERGIIDERRSYDRSTDAAIIYLKDLKEKFNTWLLVMAAYNCGENKLNEALKNQNESYVNLHLPRETERYVYRIAAIKYLMNNYGRFGYKLKQEKLYKPVKADVIQVEIKNRIYISDFVKYAEINQKTFMDLNPQLLSSLLPMGKYELYTPVGYAEKYTSALTMLSSPEYRLKTQGVNSVYIVRPGDVLFNISWETGIPVNRIKRLNRLKGSRIYPGQKLILK